MGDAGGGMTASATTSRVFAAARAAKTLLEGATWPAGGLGGADPTVGLADVDPSRDGEYVIVVPQVGADASIVWRAMPASRIERFVLSVYIVSNIGAQTDDAALTRIEALADVVQRLFYDDTQAAVTDALKALTSETVKATTPSQVQFRVGEFNNGEFGAQAEVTVPIEFYI